MIEYLFCFETIQPEVDNSEVEPTNSELMIFGKDNFDFFNNLKSINPERSINSKIAISRFIGSKLPISRSRRRYVRSLTFVPQVQNIL